MLREMPEYLPRLTAKQKAEIDESIRQAEEVRIEILKTYKHGQWTPDEHAYNMASLGDESLYGKEKDVLDADDMYSRQARKIRADAGAENKRKSGIRQSKVIEINKALIEKLNISSTYNTHRIATMIHQQWKSMEGVHRLASEDKSMTCRGDGGMPVSVRTIERWLKQHVTTFDKPKK